MTQTFLHAVAHSIDSLRAVNTKYGEKVVAEIQIKNMSKQTFWVSLKQGKKLQGCFDFLNKGRGYSTNVREVHLVLEKATKASVLSGLGHIQPKNPN